MSSPARSKNVLIGDLLVRSEMTTPRDMADAVPISLKTRLPIGRVLINTGALTEAHLQQALLAQSLIRDSLLTVEMAVQALRIVAREGYDLDQALNIVGWHPDTFTNENRLGQLLLKAGAINQAQLEDCLRIFYSAGLPLARVLVLKGIITNLVAYVALTSQQMLRDGKLSREQAVQAVQAAKASRAVIENDYLEGYLRLQPANMIRLGELFVRAKMVEDIQMIAAVEQAIGTGSTLGETLVERGVISDQTLERALETQRLVTEEILDIGRASEVLLKAEHDRTTARQAMAKLGPSVFSMSVQAPGKTTLPQPEADAPSFGLSQSQLRDLQPGPKAPKGPKLQEPALDRAEDGISKPEEKRRPLSSSGKSAGPHSEELNVDARSADQKAIQPAAECDGESTAEPDDDSVVNSCELPPELSHNTLQYSKEQMQFAQQFFVNPNNIAPAQTEHTQPAAPETDVDHELIEEAENIKAEQADGVEDSETNDSEWFNQTRPLVLTDPEFLNQTRPLVLDGPELFNNTRPLPDASSWFNQTRPLTDDASYDSSQSQPFIQMNEQQKAETALTDPLQFFNRELQLPEDVDFRIAEETENQPPKRRTREETLARELVSRLQSKIDALNTRNDYLYNMLDTKLPNMANSKLVAGDADLELGSELAEDFESTIRLIEKLFSMVESSAYRNGYLLSRVDMASVNAGVNEKLRTMEEQIERADRRARNDQQKWLESNDRMKKTLDQLAEAELRLQIVNTAEQIMTGNRSERAGVETAPLALSIQCGSTDPLQAINGILLPDVSTGPSNKQKPIEKPADKRNKNKKR